MQQHFKSETLPQRRRSLYDFGAYNPYLPSASERPLVEENLSRLHSGELSLRKFLRQTPQFPRWGDEQIAQARIVLVTNEPGLGGIEKFYGDLRTASSFEDVAERFRVAMLSWLSLTNHPEIGEINGEAPWSEDGSWQQENPRLAHCGKAGYFMAPDEEAHFCDGKILHMELSPFPQQSGRDPNPRNDQDLAYHRENLETLRKFVASATPHQPKHVLIVGNRASIRSAGRNAFKLEASRGRGKDRSNKISALLRVAQANEHHVQIRICRQWPIHGHDAEVMEVIRASAYELRPLEGPF